MEIQNKEDLQAIQSLTSRLQMQYFRELSISLSNARKMAVEQIGQTYNPPVSGAEIETAMGKARSIIYRKERIENLVIARNKKSQKHEDEKGKYGTSLTDLYRTWCENNDHISEDDELAHFAKKSRTAFFYARKLLIKDGYKFEKNGHGHNITRPTSKKMIPEDKVREMMSELIKKFME